MDTLLLGDGRLTLADAARLASAAPPTLGLLPQARERVASSQAVVARAIAEGRTCYGINTGFGRLATTAIGEADLAALQVNLVRSHAAGVGALLSRSVCRLAFALRIANLSRGASGVRVELVEQALAVFNAGVVPALPGQGSVGASGDLAPLAHMALVLIGEGQAWVGDELVDGAEALRRAGVQPLCLGPKEGLALLNGTQVSTALLTDAALLTRRLAQVADVACATTLEAYRGTATAYDERIHALRGHPGQLAVAARLRQLLHGSEILGSHSDCDKVQDNYCLRCAPQVHGASRDALGYVEAVLQREMNAVTDNPLVFENGDVLSGGNFHAQPVAIAADLLKIAVAELANISERRIELLLNPDQSGLPAFLVRSAGLCSGLMMAHVTAAALVSENKVLAHPASVDSIPTSAGKEDHVSMATHGARQAREMAGNVANVLAIELMAGFHGLALHDDELRAGSGVEAARTALATVLAPLDDDRILAPDIEAVALLVTSGALIEAVEGVVPSPGT